MLLQTKELEINGKQIVISELSMQQGLSLVDKDGSIDTARLIAESVTIDGESYTAEEIPFSMFNKLSPIVLEINNMGNDS